MQFCVHSDKQQLIRLLTDKIYQGTDYNTVLYQLCEAVAQGT